MKYEEFRKEWLKSQKDGVLRLNEHVERMDVEKLSK